MTLKLENYNYTSITLEFNNTDDKSSKELSFHKLLDYIYKTYQSEEDGKTVCDVKFIKYLFDAYGGDDIMNSPSGIYSFRDKSMIDFEGDMWDIYHNVSLEFVEFKAVTFEIYM